MSEHVSPRVNSALLPNFRGQTVRLTGKVLQVNKDTAYLQASDDGQVEVKLSPMCQMTDTFVEVVGRVEKDDTLKMMACANMGSDLDMKLVNDCIVLMHDGKFKHMF